ncbi:MAG TPA: EboA domain-containing protein [Myxococcota bacterium]|nr:EboA domain-containing protein [Myxococcota bacterium]
MSTVVETLTALLRARAPAAGQAWLAAACDEARAGGASAAAAVAAAFPAASRQLGRGPLGAALDAALPAALGGAGASVPLGAWRVDDAARALLLLALGAGDAAAARLAAARELYFSGDARERTGALRALPLLGDGPDALPAVLDAVRANQGEIFEAAVCDNAYAATHLPPLEFRKAALKCLFVGLPLARVQRLRERADADLCLGLYDYVTEREAASRAVPPEVWPLAALVPPPGLAAKLCGYLEHPDPEHRRAAATALGYLVADGDARVTPFLTDRAEREPDARVRVALATAVTAVAR